MDDRIERLQRDAARPGVICFGGGLPNDALFPRRTLCESFVEAVRGPAALQYGWPEGSERLRGWIANRLENRGADVTAADVVVTSGAQQAIALAIDALCPSRIAVDEETYPAALDLFRSRGIAAGGSGDAIYTMPGVDNPRGVGLRDRSALLARGLPVLADEAYSELRFDGVLERPLLADARDRVFHIGTVSKTLCPGLRVGWLVPPRAFLGQVLRFKHDVDLQAGSLSQAVLESFLSRDDFDARLARARKFYVARAKRMARALSRVPGLRFSMPEGGFAIFVETELAGDDRRLLELATEGGVSFDPGRLFRHDDRSAPIAFRLCFSNVSATEIDEGIRRLSSALQRFRAMRVAA